MLCPRGYHVKREVSDNVYELILASQLMLFKRKESYVVNIYFCVQAIINNMNKNIKKLTQTEQTHGLLRCLKQDKRPLVHTNQQQNVWKTFLKLVINALFKCK